MKICIDPGHGMSNRNKGIYDPGATHVENGFLFQEADIALSYALRLKEALLAKGFEVFMTRDDATDHTPVVQRARMAQDAGCDILISLHLNDVEDDSAQGVEVLYAREGSISLAQAFQDALVAATGFKDRHIKLRTELAVLKFNGNAVLIELGFIGNDNNRNTLINAQKRSVITEAIANAVKNHTQSASVNLIDENKVA